MRERLDALLNLARGQGFLTYAQVNAHLPGDVEPEQLDRLLLLLDEHGVELVEGQTEPVPALDESGWLTCTDPGRMLGLVRQVASGRKLRLLAAARSRRVWPLFKDERSRRAVEVAERLADRTATQEEVMRAQADAEAALRELRERDGLSFSKEFLFLSAPERAATQILAEDPSVVASCGLDVAYCLDFFGDQTAGALLATWEHDESALLRDLFGNLFRPPTLAPAWLTPVVLAMAKAAYDSRRFPGGHLDGSRLGGLADALEEAGCTDEGLLGHLRSPGPHALGCWALDAVLSRE